jgi:hypothetical protein
VTRATTHASFPEHDTRRAWSKSLDPRTSLAPVARRGALVECSPALTSSIMTCMARAQEPGAARDQDVSCLGGGTT